MNSNFRDLLKLKFVKDRTSRKSEKSEKCKKVTTVSVCKTDVLLISSVSVLTDSDQTLISLEFSLWIINDFKNIHDR